MNNSSILGYQMAFLFINSKEKLQHLSLILDNLKNTTSKPMGKMSKLPKLNLLLKA